MNIFFLVILAMIVASLPTVVFCQDGSKSAGQAASQVIQLPAPRADGQCSVEKALATRRSVREFKNEPLSIAALSQLVWAAQGVTQKMDAPENWSWGTWQGGKRTAPSAGALYPLEVYVLVGNINGIKPGVYKYKPQTHQLLSIDPQDKRKGLAAALGQNWVQTAPCVFVVTAVYKRTEVKYGDRATRYVHIEVGHAVENICLQAVALDLGCTMVGAFKDNEVKKVVGMADDEEPLAIVPVG